MNIILDSNVVYDYLGKRHPHYDYAVTLLSLGLQGKANISLCATTISNGIYIFRHNDPTLVHQNFALLLNRFTVLPLSAQVLQAGLASDFSDKEDAFIHYSAVLHGEQYGGAPITHLVTRNPADFQAGELAVVSPVEMIDVLTLPNGE